MHKHYRCTYLHPCSPLIIPWDSSNGQWSSVEIMTSWEEFVIRDFLKISCMWLNDQKKLYQRGTIKNNFLTWQKPETKSHQPRCVSDNLEDVRFFITAGCCLLRYHFLHAIHCLKKSKHTCKLILISIYERIQLGKSTVWIKSGMNQVVKRDNRKGIQVTSSSLPI